jgi:hypothetical protein
VLPPVISIALYIHSVNERSVRIKTQMRADEKLVVQQAIHQYTIDEGKPSKSLNDLVIGGYLKALPGEGQMYFDPVTPPASVHPKSTSASAGPRSSTGQT